VLVFLWAAGVVVGGVAFFAVLFTGRCPRPLFGFTTGVLRWSRRVGYYTAVPWEPTATSRCPARLEVACPKRLSRGLVLVKWGCRPFRTMWSWPLLCGGLRVVWTSGGLISVLVLFAGVALLFTGVYPGGAEPWSVAAPPG